MASAVGNPQQKLNLWRILSL